MTRLLAAMEQDRSRSYTEALVTTRFGLSTQMKELLRLGPARTSVTEVSEMITFMAQMQLMKFSVTIKERLVLQKSKL